MNSKTARQQVKGLLLSGALTALLGWRTDTTQPEKNHETTAQPHSFEDPYSHFITNGFGKYTTIVSGELLVGGKVPELENHGTSFDLDTDTDPRYQACLKEAKLLKEKFPLNGLNPNIPEDYSKIVRYEARHC